MMTEKKKRRDSRRFFCVLVLLRRGRRGLGETLGLLLRVALFTGLRDIAVVIHLLEHRIARIAIRARVDGVRRKEQAGRNEADDQGETPALLIWIERRAHMAKLVWVNGTTAT
jgi:hypothetical protein